MKTQAADAPVQCVEEGERHTHTDREMEIGVVESMCPSSCSMTSNRAITAAGIDLKG